jgi:stearoyl-CoA desaturase (delta-9 desaturase)
MSLPATVDPSENLDLVPDEPRVFGELPLPPAAQPVRLFFLYVVPLVTLHVLALLAFFPWFFSWSGLVVAIAGHFFFGMFGITIGYHRLLTHRGFTCPKWLERSFAILGICNLQDSPARWVAIHRMHHQHSDHEQDPHSPLVNFFWGHVGWVLVQSRAHGHINNFERYARDLLRDPFYLKLERGGLWFYVYVLHALIIAGAGSAYGSISGGSPLQMGLSWLVWGVFVRTVFVLNGTWAVNSVTHRWGYRNYETRDNSRNSWLVALFSHGEGWHNNHHAQPRAARHGHRWWEFDCSWICIRLMEMVGLAKDVVRPK